VILYQLLSGRLPYEVNHRQLPEAAHAIREEEPPGLGAIDRNYRGDLETIARKALEKDKARRYTPGHQAPPTSLCQLKKPHPWLCERAGRRRQESRRRMALDRVSLYAGRSHLLLVVGISTLPPELPPDNRHR